MALVQQYEDARTRPLATYEEDLDVTSTTIRGGAIRAEGLTDWSERRINLKWDPLETRGVTLGWNRAGGAPAWYALTLPESLRVTGDSVLTFDLADAGRDPRSPRHESPGRGPAPTPSTADGGGPPAAADSGDGLDLTVELIAGGGATARLPLSSVSALRRQVRAEVAKAPVLTNIPRSEVVFQSFAFPLAAFAARNPAFDARSLRTVRWVFDRTAKGVVILDNVGLR